MKLREIEEMLQLVQNGSQNWSQNGSQNVSGAGEGGQPMPCQQKTALLTSLSKVFEGY